MYFAAQDRTYEIGRYYSHTRPNGKMCLSVLDDYNISYSTAGENIIIGCYSAEDAFESWMNSPPHKANMLDPSYTHFCVATTTDNGAWVQLFIG